MSVIYSSVASLCVGGSTAAMRKFTADGDALPWLEIEEWRLYKYGVAELVVWLKW